MIKVKNINKYYNYRKDNEIHVINDTSFCINGNGLVAILGASGSGKTTLLNSLCGIDSLDNGTLTIDDHVIEKYKSGKMDDLRSKYFGYIFQNYNLIGDMTVFDNVAFSLEMIGIKDKEEIRRRTMRALEIVQMDKYKKRYAKNLSGGQQQRVSIARAIVKDPRYILADEPTGNLDRKNTVITMSILKEISAKCLVIMVTHERELAYSYADRIMEIKDGVVVADKSNISEDNKYVYNDENLIHLGNLEKNTLLDNNNVEVTRYTKEGQEGNIKIDFVVIDNQIFVRSTSKDCQIRIVDENSLVKFTDAKIEDESLPLINKEDVEIESIDYSKIKGHYHVNFFKLFVDSFIKLIKMKFIKRLVLLLFLVSSFLLTISMGLYRGTSYINEKEFMTTNRDLININLENYSIDEVIKEYDEITNRPEIYDVVFNNANSVKITKEVYNNTYYGMNDLQLQNIVIQNANKFDNISNDLVNKLDDNSVIIDQKIIDTLLTDDNYKYYFQTAKTILNQQIIINDVSYKIIGVVDNQNLSVYVNNNNAIKSHYYNDIFIGSVPVTCLINNELNNKEIILSSEYELLYNENEDIDFNGYKCKIVGFNSSQSKKVELNQETLEKINLYSMYQGSSISFHVLSNNYQETLDAYPNGGKTIVFSEYATAREMTKSSKLTTSTVILFFAIMSFIAPLIMLYFLMRSSTLNKSKEIGIYRALGMRNRSIISMNFIEIITLEMIFAIPGYLAALFFMNSISSKFQTMVLFRIDGITIILSLILIIVLITFVGLIPILRLIKKTPQKIMTKYDI